MAYQQGELFSRLFASTTETHARRLWLSVRPTARLARSTTSRRLQWSTTELWLSLPTSHAALRSTNAYAALWNAYAARFPWHDAAWHVDAALQPGDDAAITNGSWTARWTAWSGRSSTCGYRCSGSSAERPTCQSACSLPVRQDQGYRREVCALRIQYRRGLRGLLDRETTQCACPLSLLQMHPERSHRPLDRYEVGSG